MANMRNCNLLVSVVTGIVGALIATTSYSYGIEVTLYGPGAGFWPFFLGLSLLIVAAVLLFDTIRNSGKYVLEPVVLSNPGNIAAYHMMALVCGYGVTMFVIGFYPSTFIFMFAAMYMLGLRNYKLMLAVVLLFLGFIFLVFTQLLNIFLPLPFFID